MEIIHVFYMVMLLVFLIVLAFYIKKHGVALKTKQSNIFELERFYYSPKSYISIVKIAEEVFVLGITENNINYLKDLKDKEFLDKINLEENNKVKAKTQFSEILKLRQSSIGGLKNRLEKMRSNQDEEV